LGLKILLAVSQQGHFRFMCARDPVNAGVFIEILRRLIHNAERRIILIVDGHQTHKAKSVRPFVDAVSDRLEIVFLLPYAPELNRDELVWNDLKNNARGRKAIAGPEHLKRKAS
jgi:transposase